jgi:hypothetical protein
VAHDSVSLYKDHRTFMESGGCIIPVVPQEHGGGGSTLVRWPRSLT